MDNIELDHKAIEKFILKFLREIKEYKELFSELGLKAENYMPKIFTNENLGVHAIYSNNKKHILIRFDQREKFHFLSSEVEQDIFDLFDPSGLWKKGYAFSINNSYVTLNNTQISGMKPFKLVGDDLELVIDNLDFEIPRYGKINIEYAFIYSYKNFIKMTNNIRDFLARFMSVIHEFKKQKMPPGPYKQYLEGLKQKMEVLFFDENTPELTIDKFIEMNPVILELGLQLTRPISQVVLKNILKLYPHDLKPDLIAFDNRSRNWIIVDYKKAKRTVLKNVDSVRTGFRAEVYSLKDQLRDYVRYFREREHRIQFKNTYGREIKRPRAIGIIGNVNANEQEDFEDLIMEEFNNQFNVIPYNYLYENFCQSVDYAFKFVK